MSRSDRWSAALGARLLRNRAIVRAPVRLFQLGLGPLLGRRVVMLGHRGRTTGRLRFVVPENLAPPGAGAPVVVSGFGERSQWCRNVRADPQVQLWWATREPRPAQAVPLDVERARSLVAAYARAHPVAWRQLAPAMAEVSGRDIDPAVFDLPVFELRLSG